MLQNAVRGFDDMSRYQKVIFCRHFVRHADAIPTAHAHKRLRAAHPGGPEAALTEEVLDCGMRELR